MYNIGTDCEKSNLEVAWSVLRAFGREAEADRLIQYVEDRKFNDYRYFIDSAKLHALGWRPQVSFEEGLKLTSTLTEHGRSQTEGTERGLLTVDGPVYPRRGGAAVEWYRTHPNYWENVDAALAAHPVRLSSTHWFPR